MKFKANNLLNNTMAEKLGLKVNETTGNIHILDEMIKDNKDDRFIQLAPGEAITEEMFRTIDWES